MKSVSCCLIFLFLIAFFSALPASQAEEKREAFESSSAQPGMHAQPWAFGNSPDRNAPIWRQGLDGKSINPVKKGASTGKISRPGAGEGKQNIKSSLGLSLRDEAGTWKVTPSQKDIRPDERHVRENKHILGAYAGVEAGDDFNISVGPELILKDDSRGDESAHSEQPDSVWGMGMKFKYDF